MDTNTHTEIVIGNGFTAIMSGVPDKCEHQWDGKQYCETSDGEILMEHSDKHNIVGGGVTCSKCEKSFTPPMF